MITQIDNFMKHKTLSPRLHTLLTEIKVDLKLREEAKEEHRLRVVELEGRVAELTEALGPDITISRADGDLNGKGFPVSFILKKGNKNCTFVAGSLRTRDVYE